ncbi:MAG: neutral/alkaline non-lysosomal ceramidase N-terminal domain-containing protein [Planctomycetes bacterium]|nr:neutral/alkaline non-lysosomal ceramidase N-terminal domain-containing protein [Planctomycetota bacterium]
MTATGTKLRQLRAGVARCVITPPVGIRMLGYTVQEECSRSVQDELLATAIVLTDGTEILAIVSCDLLHIQNPHADRIREHISQRAPVPAANVLLNFSHTHLGPMLPGWQPEDAEQGRIQQHYLDFLTEALAGVVATACDRLQPARLGSARGVAPLGINRREKMPDGTVIIGENPDGAIDRTIDVIRVDDLSGKTIAVLGSAAVHTIVLGPRTTALSPDFIGPARRIIESTTDAPFLFLQGAAGNICPVSGIGAGGPEQFDDQQRLGAMLGGEVVKTWGQIRTHNRRGPRRIVKSVAMLSTWNYEPVADETIEHFGVASKRLVMDLAPLPEPKVVQEQLAKWSREREAVLADASATPGRRHVVNRMWQWAQLVADTLARGENPPRQEVDIWVARINDIGLAAVSAEPLAELGLEVKQRSKLPHTLFLGYSNGCLGYIPPPQAFAEGGMEVVESTWNYHLPSQLTPEWGPAVVNTALELLSQV